MRTTRRWKPPDAVSILRVTRNPGARQARLRRAGGHPSAAGVSRLRAAFHDLRAARAGEPDAGQEGWAAPGVRPREAARQPAEGLHETADQLRDDRPDRRPGRERPARPRRAGGPE